VRFPVAIARFATALLDWYKEHKRDLPWRKTDNPYHVWLSEIMLQQTQVKVVTPYFLRFLSEFPTIKDLAQADLEKVLALWSGLGYYARARNLHMAAKQICEHYQGVFPADREQALSLKGVGRYTAGAVHSIAYGKPEPIVDGNIRRVMARFTGIEEPLSSSPELLWSLLARVVRDPVVRCSVSQFNQSLMELGALVCVPGNPKCGVCPIAFGCRARKRGAQGKIPVPIRPPRVEKKSFIAGVIQSKGRLLLNRNPTNGLIEGLWDLPLVQSDFKGPVSELPADFLREHGLKVKVIGELSNVRHQITFRRLLFRPILLRLEREAIEGADWRWAYMDSKQVPVPSYVRKIWALSVAHERHPSL